VVMTFRATDRHAHKRRRDRVRRVDGQVLRILARAACEKTEGKLIPGPRLLAGAIACGRHLRTLAGAAPGQLKLHKLVVGHIVVESVDDPIPPQMNARGGCQPLIRIRIAQHVQPMPCVTNRMLFIRQKLIDHLFIGVRRWVREEGVLLGRRRWKANQVQIHPAQQR